MPTTGRQGEGGTAVSEQGSTSFMVPPTSPHVGGWQACAPGAGQAPGGMELDASQEVKLRFAVESCSATLGLSRGNIASTRL